VRSLCGAVTGMIAAYALRYRSGTDGGALTKLSRLPREASEDSKCENEKKP
jgi:hypothetical protein